MEVMRWKRASVFITYIHTYIHKEPAGSTADCVQQTNKRRKGKDESNTKIHVRERQQEKDSYNNRYEVITRQPTSVRKLTVSDGGDGGERQLLLHT